MIWKNSQILAEFHLLLFVHLKMAKSWATFVQNFNESSRYSTKVFQVLNFRFEQNFISFMTEIFHFMKISQLPKKDRRLIKALLSNINLVRVSKCQTTHTIAKIAALNFYNILSSVFVFSRLMASQLIFNQPVWLFTWRLGIQHNGTQDNDNQHKTDDCHLCKVSQISHLY